MSKYYRNSNTKSVVLTVIVTLIIGVCALFGFLYWEHICAFFDDVGKYFEKVDDEVEKNKDSGFFIGNGENFGENVFVSCAAVPAAQYDDYGVSAAAESAYTLTATVEPENAANKKLAWYASFVNSGSEWASGKNVTDYVTVSVSGENGENALVTCLQPFGEQIEIKVVSQENGGKFAAVTCDYEKRVIDIESISFTNAGGVVYTSGGSAPNEIWDRSKEAFLENEEKLIENVECVFEYSVGTVTPDEPEFSFDIKATVSLISFAENRVSSELMALLQESRVDGRTLMVCGGFWENLIELGSDCCEEFVNLLCDYVSEGNEGAIAVITVYPLNSSEYTNFLLYLDYEVWKTPVENVTVSTGSLLF